MRRYEVFHLDSTNDLEVDQLKNEFTGQFENSAIVTVTLNKLNGKPVGGASWPLALTHVDSSNGRYVIFLPKTLDLAPGDRCTARIEAVSPTGYSKRWDLRIIAMLDDDSNHCS